MARRRGRGRGQEKVAAGRRRACVTRQPCQSSPHCRCEGAACASKPLALGSFAAAYVSYVAVAAAVSPGYSIPHSISPLRGSAPSHPAHPTCCAAPRLQSNTGLRVLRLRGASGLSIRAVRAAAEALRRNTTLRELDLSGATFLAADPDLLLSTSVSVGGVGAGISGYASAAATPSHRQHQQYQQQHTGSLARLSSAAGHAHGHQHHFRSNSHSHPSGGGGGGEVLPALPRPSSLKSIGSSRSTQSLVALARGQQVCVCVCVCVCARVCVIINEARPDSVGVTYGYLPIPSVCVCVCWLGAWVAAE